MDASGWTVVAACASAASATAALIAVCFTARSSNAQVKAADFSNCIAVVTQLGDAVRRVRDANDDPIKEPAEFHELLNLLEALALLINDRKIAPSTLRFAEHFLQESMAWIKVSPKLNFMMQRSLTSDSTYSELFRFADRRSMVISALAKSYRSQKGD